MAIFAISLLWEEEEFQVAANQREFPTLKVLEDSRGIRGFGPPVTMIGELLVLHKRRTLIAAPVPLRVSR
jgi:hypothetical protein